MHESVLLEEAIDLLHLQETDTVVDATVGYGGHSKNILKRIKRGVLFAFDQDSEAIKFSTNNLHTVGTNFTIIKSNFANMKEELQKRGITKVDKILFDLGVSSPQLDEKERGFSYHQDAKLDMRMNQEQEFSAYELVNTYSKEELTRVFKEYGEAQFASNIAKKIVEKRKEHPIETTLELVEIIKSAVPMKFRISKHPAKQIFQAIRIEVNDELASLKKALHDSKDLLNVNGRIVVITFHSLEDRIVKNYFRELSQIDEKIKGLPNVDPSLLPDFKLVTRKGIKPSKEEIEKNKRAHSAIVRAIEKVK